MSPHVFQPWTFHPRACANCEHGENLHPPRTQGACARSTCPCLVFEPLKGKSIIAALGSRLSKPTPRDWTWR